MVVHEIRRWIDTGCARSFSREEKPPLCEFAALWYLSLESRERPKIMAESTIIDTTYQERRQPCRLYDMLTSILHGAIR